MKRNKYTVKFKYSSLVIKGIYKLKDQNNNINLNVIFEERKCTFLLFFFFL